MKILIVAGIWKPELGGPATFGAEISARLVASGHQVTVLTYSPKNPSVGSIRPATVPFSVIRVWRKVNKFSNYWRYFLEMQRVLKNDRPDLVYMLDWFSAGVPAALACKLGRVPYIVRVGGGYIWEKYLTKGRPPMTLREFYERRLYLRYPLMFGLIGWVFRGAQTVIFNSDDQRLLFEKPYRLGPNQARTIYNVAPESEYLPSIADANRRHEIVFAGRLIVIKNVASLIRAFARLADQSFTLCIIGEGPDKKSLQRLVDELNIASRTRFLPPMPSTELYRHIRDAYLVVIPSWTDISPYQAYECLALDVPFLLTKENYLPFDMGDILKIDPASVDDIAEKLNRLLDGPEYRTFAASLRRLVFRWTWFDVLNAHERIFADLGFSTSTNVIVIGTDRKVFEEGSAVRQRLIEYGGLVDRLDVVVFALKSHHVSSRQLSPNVWAYATNSHSRFFYIQDAKKIVTKIIRENNFRPVNTIISTQDPFETGLVGTFLKKRFGLKLQTQIHTDFLSPYFWRHSLFNFLRAFIAWRVLPLADQIRVVSRRIEQSLAKYASKINRKKIAVLPIYTDPERFKAPPTFNLSEKYPQFSETILMSSRLTLEKNISFALRVFKDVLVDMPTVGLIIVGAGPEEKHLKRLANSLGIAESTIFEPWTNDVASYYKTADIFLSTSLYEGYSLTLVEAGLSGAAVVTSDVGIAGDLLKDGKNIRVCPVNDKACYIRVLKELLASLDIRQTLGRNARLDLETVLVSKEDFLQDYKNLFKKTLHDDTR